MPPRVRTLSEEILRESWGEPAWEELPQGQGQAQAQAARRRSATAKKRNSRSAPSPAPAHGLNASEGAHAGGSSPGIDVHSLSRADPSSNGSKTGAGPSRTDTRKTTTKTNAVRNALEQFCKELGAAIGKIFMEVTVPLIMVALVSKVWFGKEHVNAGCGVECS